MHFKIVLPRQRQSDSPFIVSQRLEVHRNLTISLSPLGSVTYHIRDQEADNATSGTFVRFSTESLEQADLVIADITLPRGEVRDALITARIASRRLLLIHSSQFVPSLPPEIITNSKDPFMTFAYEKPSDLLSDIPLSLEYINRRIKEHESIGKAFSNLPRSSDSFLETVKKLTAKPTRPSQFPMRLKTA